MFFSHSNDERGKHRVYAAYSKREKLCETETAIARA